MVAVTILFILCVILTIRAIDLTKKEPRYRRRYHRYWSPQAPIYLLPKNTHEHPHPRSSHNHYPTPRCHFLVSYRPGDGVESSPIRSIALN